MRIAHFSDLKPLSDLGRPANAQLYRGIDRRDQKKVIVKLCFKNLPVAAARLRHEYHIYSIIESPHMAQAMEWIEDIDQVAIIFIDEGAVDLAQWLQTADWNLEQRLGLALQMVDALAALHQQNLIHKDINPANFIFLEHHNRLQLIDFELATWLSREESPMTNFGLIDGNPYYCAPEQTGRMNRPVDHRSDFYSLGAALYHLFVGAPPFASGDTLELVHAHIAIEPEPPSARAPRVPQGLSDIILKLLCKAPEDRYQSLAGVRADLAAALEAWHRDGAIAAFELARQDREAGFRIPQKLYGREADLADLIAGFEQAASGSPAVSLVTGPSGIGKTTVIQQLYEPITRRKAFFISGKFDQFQRDRPYSAFANAFQQLFREILTEPEERLQQWRTMLQGAVGENGGMLMSLVAELEWILGPQTYISDLEPDEYTRVFKRIILRVIGVFCSPEHPLVIYLDDLQWADRASLELLSLLIQENDIRNLYLLGAYRDTEVAADHPLMDLIEHLERSSVSVRRIHLGALPLTAEIELLTDCLRQPAELTRVLAEHISRKTGGVPFFIHQFLESLERNGAIQPDPLHGGWTCALGALDALPVTANQVEWMAAQLRLLEPAAQHYLQVAACLGNQFDLAWLACVEDAPLENVLQALKTPIEQGLISISRQPLKMTRELTGEPEEKLEGRFAHDRIQQAAYVLVPDANQSIHRRIGDVYRARLTAAQRGKLLFDLVTHLNQGYPLPLNPDTVSVEQQLDLCALNLQAGRRAQQSAANATALHFFEEGIARLPPGDWQAHYELTLTLYQSAIEAAYLSGRHDLVTSLGAEVVHHARNLLDCKAFYNVQIQSYNVQNKLKEAIQTALSFLRQLNVNFPRKASLAHVLLAIAKTKFLLANKSIDDLSRLPDMQDAHQLAVMETLNRVASSAYFADPMLHPLIVLKMVRMSARYGNSSVSGVSYATYGIILCGVLNQFREGLAFGEFSQTLVKRFRAQSLKCRTSLLVNVFVQHWTYYAGESIEAYRQAYLDGMETGDHEYGLYACSMECVTSSFVGRPLSEVAALVEHYHPVVSQLSQGTAWMIHRAHAQTVENLRTPSNYPWQLKGRFGDEDRWEQECGQDHTGLCLLRIVQLKMAYYFGQYDVAAKRLEQAASVLEAARAMLVTADYHFFGALTRIALYRSSEGATKRRQKRQIKAHRAQLKIWAQAAPMNFKHKLRLVDAEWLRASGNPLAALEAYEDAIVTAHDHSFLQDQALAEQLAGENCLERGMEKMARTYLWDSSAHFEQWGAVTLCQFNKERYGTQIDMRLSARGAINGTTRSWTESEFDLAAFKKALKAISQSRSHSAMMETVIQGAVTFAGAQSGHLLLTRPGGELFVEAQWTTGQEQAVVQQGTLAKNATQICQPVLHYVRRTQKSLVIADAQKPQNEVPNLHRDPDVIARGVRSILCTPLFSGVDATTLIGLLYLENCATAGAFTASRIDTLEVICLAAAGRLELSRKAITDGLTGLYNHEYFQNTLDKELQRSKRTGLPVSVILLDVDHFKQFNDRWGHQAGDKVLGTVAEAIQHCCRESDTAARYGGEEMVVIAPETNEVGANILAERIRSAVAATEVHYQGQILKVTLSAGFATWTDESLKKDALIQIADEALYQAKKLGRNRVCGREETRAAG